MSVVSKMFLSPSTIHYISTDKDNVLRASVDQNIIEVSRTICHNGDMPKVQCVEKDGLWFTLNNSQLDLCRRLEADGKCTKVPVDIVPLNDVPRSVRNMMLAPTHVESGVEASSAAAADLPKCQDSNSATGCSDPSRKTGKGYQKLGQMDPNEERAHGSDSDSAASESSDFVDTDSECDWSEEDPESSECESTDGEGGDGKAEGAKPDEKEESTDDERECLL